MKEKQKGKANMRRQEKQRGDTIVYSKPPLPQGFPFGKRQMNRVEKGSRNLFGLGK